VYIIQYKIGPVCVHEFNIISDHRHFEQTEYFLTHYCVYVTMLCVPTVSKC